MASTPLKVKNITNSIVIIPGSLAYNPGYRSPWPELAGASHVTIRPGQTIQVDSDVWFQVTAANPLVIAQNPFSKSLVVVK